MQQTTNKPDKMFYEPDKLEFTFKVSEPKKEIPKTPAKLPEWFKDANEVINYGR